MKTNEEILKEAGWWAYHDEEGNSRIPQKYVLSFMDLARIEAKKELEQELKEAREIIKHRENLINKLTEKNIQSQSTINISSDTLLSVFEKYKEVLSKDPDKIQQVIQELGSMFSTPLPKGSVSEEVLRGIFEAGKQYGIEQQGYDFGNLKLHQCTALDFDDYIKQNPLPQGTQISKHKIVKIMYKLSDSGDDMTWLDSDKFIEAAEEISRLDNSESDLNRLYSWLFMDNRPKAQTFFTAGALRNVAKEIEFRLDGNKNPDKKDWTNFNDYGAT